MLRIPAVGFARSVNTHKVQLDVFCDWIEGSTLFGDEGELSTTDVVDILVDGMVYAEQDYAREFAANGWSELERRQRLMGASSPFDIAGSRIKRKVHWHDTAALSFLLMLAFSKWYPKWASQFGSDYTEQGALFEDLTREALNYILPGWETYVTGWSKTSARKLHEVVTVIASHVCEPIGPVERWTTESANEAGLDILCYRPLGDGRVGLPVYLVQCASGGNWQAKLHTPDLRIWARIIDFACVPRKAFSLPFALADGEMTRVINLVDGLVLDRYRLLLPGTKNREWVSAELKARLVDWLTPRVAVLPLNGA